MKSIKLGQIVDYINAEVIQADDDWRDREISREYIHRFGLELICPKSDLGPGKIMAFGVREKHFITTLSSNEKREIFDDIFSSNFTALFVANSIIPENLILNFAKKYSVPIFSVKMKTYKLISELTNYLEEYLEPSITRPAGFMSVHGEGVLLTGESGIGKSEVALELIHRGHKFISDDLVEIRKLSSHLLVGNSPDNISRFIEVRGIGIINVQQLFGINATKPSENIDLIVNFEIWKDDRAYDRLGSEKYVEILGIKVPYVSIPVKPGKNLAVLVEVAAMNNRLKKLGMNPYNEFLTKLFGTDHGLKSKLPEKVTSLFE